MRSYAFRFGNETLEVSLPEKQVVNVVCGKTVSPVTDVPAAVKAALNNPIGAQPLKSLPAKGDKVTIIASDITRRWVRFDLFLPVLLDELNTAGIPDEDISLIVALGAHRRHTDEENILTFGQEVVNRLSIRQSHSQTTADFVKAGTTSRGTPVWINKHVAAADKVILTGGIVYHIMAGFGGGRKAILPGVAAYHSIQANHRLCLHREEGNGINPDAYSGSLSNNPMNLDLLEIAEMVKPAFLLNAVFTPAGQFARIVAGHWLHAWIEGCREVEAIFSVPIREKTDLVIASAGGHPKDINLYQTTKTIDNAYKAVKENGAVILLLECRDIHDPPDFSEWFRYTSLGDREAALRASFSVPGFAALKIGQISQKIPLIVVSLPQNRDFLEKAGVIAASSVDEAMAIARRFIGRDNYSITVMPNAADTLPVLKDATAPVEKKCVKHAPEFTTLQS